MKICTSLEMTKKEILQDYSEFLNEHLDMDTVLEEGFPGLKNLSVKDILNDKEYIKVLVGHLLSINTGSLSREVVSDSNPTVPTFQLKVGKDSIIINFDELDVGY